MRDYSDEKTVKVKTDTFGTYKKGPNIAETMTAKTTVSANAKKHSLA